MVEHDPDMTPEEKYSGGDPAYAKEDQKRVDRFHKGLWDFVGVLAEVDVIVGGTVQHIASPGLWGIESDSGEKYLREVANEEYAQLVDILGRLGVPRSKVPSFRSAKWKRG